MWTREAAHIAYCPRAVMIELKGDGPSGKIDKSSNIAPFSVRSMPLLDNGRYHR